MTDLATELTAYAIKTESEWPFVTMSLFEVNAYHARKLSGVEAIGVAPFVYRDDRKAWEAYSSENYGWIDESRSLVLDDTYKTREYQTASILPMIYEVKNMSDPNIIPVPVDPESEVSPTKSCFFVNLQSYRPTIQRSLYLHLFSSLCPSGSFHHHRFMDF